MAKSNPPEAVSTYSPEAIEVIVDHIRGLRSLDGAAKELYRLTGLLPDYGKALLKAMKNGSARTNATVVRGYSKEPERTRLGKIGKPNETRLR
jgi:hypothetical protein